MVTNQNCNTHNQICSKITPEEEHRKSFGSTHLLVKCKNKRYEKCFWQLIDTRFPPASKLRKILTVTPLKSVKAALKIYHKL